MRSFAALLTVVVMVSCGSAGPLRTPAVPVRDLVIPTSVPNGKVEVVVKSGYAVGDTVRATVRLSPTSGTLRGPVDPLIQASGFHGTATVRHLPVAPLTASAGGAEVAVSWDMRDDAGSAVGSDDYSLVFDVIDDAGRTTTVGATLQVR
jgi:hypothetical protein